MKIKHKKIAASGISLALAGVLGVGALLQTTVSVQASSAMMPGIEQIVNETTADEPFKILEIVDNTSEAEIGYYVSGQEPYIKLYSYTYKYTGDDGGEKEKTIHFNTLEEGLEQLPTKELRQEFASNTKTDSDGSEIKTGIKDVKNVSYQEGSSESSANYPLSYSTYAEKYFITEEESASNKWTLINFKDILTGKSRTDTVQIKGYYQENASGTGDYTKQEQKYYPIREDNDEDKAKTEKYREDIKNFYYADNDGASAPYHIVFEAVENATLNDNFDEQGKKKASNNIQSEYTNGNYGYYENVYSDLTEEIVENIYSGKYTFPGENPYVDITNAKEIVNNSVTSANAFSTGTDEFASVDDNTDQQAEQDSTAETPQTDDSFTADAAFSDGDFTSDADNTDINSDSQNTTDLDNNTGTDSASGTTDGDIGAATADDSTDTSGSEINTSTDGSLTPLIEYKPDSSGGTSVNPGGQSDPYVYYGVTIDKYPYYKYTLISDLNAVKALAELNAEAIKNGTFKLNGNANNKPINDGNQYCNITLQDGQYWFWLWDADKDPDETAVKYPISIVTQRQPVSYDDVHKVADSLGYNYYYKVSQVYFCCKNATDSNGTDSYAYYGWYSPTYNDETKPYVSETDSNKATHYISDAEYKLTPGTGDYDFISDDTKDSQKVEVDHMYYQGGYTNHDWFKRYVFHLTDTTEEEKKQFDNFKIEVTTMTAKEFNDTYGNAASNNSDADADSGANADAGTSDGTDPDTSVSDPTSDTQSTDAGEVSEVESMVSEAGVELVSIENELSDGTSADTTDTEFQDGTEDTDDISDDTTTFSAGETETTTTTNTLSDYDLVYINGNISEDAAEKLSGIPTIINAAKAENTENTGINNAYSSFIKADDEDGHYVNTYVYFFKNTFAQTSDTSGAANSVSSLLNINFNTDFNTDADSDTSGDNISDDTTTTSPTQGFEEILKYIESENQYRQLGQTTDNLTDGTGVELLKKNLSQARAIEYIINYKLKRNLTTKSEINILEIQPAKSSGQITENTVLSWLGYDVDETEEVTACCYEENGEPGGNGPVDKMTDGNKSTYWHSHWSGGNKHEDNHYITITYKNPITFRGIEYLPRYATANGTIEEFRLTYTLNDERQVTVENCSFGNGNGGYQKYTLPESIGGVTQIKIEILKSKHDTGSQEAQFASCAELKIDKTYDSYPEINITRMTASEFVGHIDDIGSEYDMIYIGSDKDSTITDIDLTTGSGEMCYTHVGAARGITLENASSMTNKLFRLMGQLDIDYDSGTDSSGKQRLATINTYSENGAGYYRGSGNDMTDQIRSELIEFVKSGYPVVINTGLMNNDSTVNTNKVDTSSYYYQFMTEALKYSNVFSSAELEDNSDTLGFFSNLSKPVINFDEKPAEPPRANKKIENAALITSGELKYVFTIENDSDAMPALTTYDCNLYMDLNFDGNLSDKESQDSYIEISDESGNVLSQITDDSGKSHYELQAGRKYTLIRKLPKSYFKIITWKLEIRSNRNSYVHTSEMGYAKQSRGNAAAQTIKVLQLTAYKNGNNWDLNNGRFKSKLNQLTDFDFNIEITSLSVNDVNNYTGADNMKNKLADYDMLIIGFTDGYDNISNDKHQVDAIVDFIKSGKSVLFSHDTTSYINYDQDKMHSSVAMTSYGLDDSVSLRQEPDGFKSWGYSLNKTLRSIVGMDRYGITSTEEINTKNNEAQTVSELLKKGQELTNNNEVSFNDLAEIAGDIAYQAGTRTESYAQTQGYSNEYVSTVAGDGRVTTAQKINDGAITQYPYVIEDEITVAQTHGQYYQLGLEQDRDINKRSDGKSDVVVWYTLTGNYYSNSPKDVRNNYYFYSKGNVIYTGAGHSSVDNATGNDQEIELFINAITAAANVTAVEPEVKFIKSLNPNAEKETTRYYMTDQEKWSNSATNVVNNNLDFYINVRDYNMVSADLNQEDLDKQEITLQFYIESDNGEGQEVNGTSVKLLDITNKINNISEYGGSAGGIAVSADGKFHTKKSNAFGFTISDIESYLKSSSGNGYKSSCKVYAKISSTVYLYGEPKTQTVWTSIDLKQRQLFDMD